MVYNLFEPGNAARLAFDMLHQPRNELELRTTVGAPEFGSIMGRRVKVLIQAIKGLESRVTDITLVTVAIKRTFVSGECDQVSRWLDWTTDTTVYGNLWYNIEFMDCGCDLMTIDLMTARLDMHGDSRWCLERVLTEGTA